MNRVRKALMVAVVASVLAATGCSSPSDEAALPEGAIVIDVRTPAEYAEGHLEGAKNVDVQGADFEAEIAAFDKEDTYYVYCRSGNRSATAVQQMDSMGFTDVVDGGGIDEASKATGLKIVSD